MVLKGSGLIGSASPRSFGWPVCAAIMLCLAGFAVAAPSASASSEGVLEALLRGSDTSAQAIKVRHTASQLSPAPSRPASALSGVADAASDLAGSLRSQASAERIERAKLQLLASLLLADAEFDAQAARLRASGVADANPAHARLQAVRARLQAERDGLEPLLAALDAKDVSAPPALLERLDRAGRPPSVSRTFGVSPPVLRPRLQPRGLPGGIWIRPSYAQPELEPALPEDVQPGDEAVLSTTIRNLAASFGNDYIAIADHVRSTVRTEWRAGSAQSVEETLRRGAGNDVEQASLLIALLRASGAPARYVTGTVEMPLEALSQQIGVPEGRLGMALAAAGIAHEPLIEAGRIVGFRFEQVWVSARVPYGNYRGSMADDGQPLWLPLMPALKPAQFDPGTPILQMLDFDPEAWVDQHLATPPSAAPWRSLRDHWTSLLAGGQPPSRLSALQGHLELDAPPLGLLPASTPHRVAAVYHESAELLDTQRVWLQVQLVDQLGAPLLDQRLALSSLSALRFTLAYLPATVEDQHLANQRGGLGALPAYLIRLRPTLLAGGEPVAAGEGMVDAGDGHHLQLHLQGPAGEVSVEQQIIAGTLASWSMDVAGAAPVPGTSEDVDSDTVAARVLGRFAERYLAEWARDEQEIAAALGVRLLRPLPAIALALPQYQGEGVFGLVDRFDFKGVALDAAARPLEPMSLRADASDEAHFLRLSALHGSALESSLFEQLWAVDALSAERALQRAAETGMPIIELAPFANTDALTAHPNALRARLQQWLDAGYAVRIPHDPLRAGAWQGTAWRVQHPDSGETGYFLSGDYAGGVTVIPPGLWFFRELAEALAEPYAPLPNRDPLAAILVQLDVVSQNQIARAGEWFEHPLRVAVSDLSGLPVEGAEVRFLIASGGGLLESGADGAIDVTARSDARGIASLRLKAPERGAGLPRTLLRLPGDAHPQRAYVTRIDVVVTTREGPLTPALPFAARMIAGDPVRVELESRGLVVPYPAPISDRIWAGLDVMRYRLLVLDAFDNPVSNQLVSAEVSDRYTGPPCQGDFNLPGSRLFVDGACPADVPLLAGHACTSASLDTLTRQDGVDLHVVPSSIHHTEVSLRASSAVGSDLQQFTTFGEWLEIDDENRCRHRPVVATVGSSRDDPFEVAMLGQRMAHSRLLQGLRTESGAGTVGAVWVPADIENLTLDVEGGQSVDLRRVGTGTYRFELEAGAEPGRITIQAGGSIASLYQRLPLPSAWAVELPMPLLQPEVLDLDAFQVTTHPLWVEVPLLPEQYRAAFLRIEIVDDLGGVLTSCHIEGGSNGTACRFSRGLRLPAERSFRARYVVNPSDSAPLVSAEAALPLDRDILVGFGALDGDEAPPDLEQFVARRFQPVLELQTEVDTQTAYVCKLGARFVHALGREARVDLRFYSLDEDGRRDREVWHPIDARTQAAGVYEQGISVDEIDFGVYEYELTAEADGRVETRTGRLIHREKRRDSLPLAHSFVKGVDVHDGHAVVSVEDAAIGGRGPGMRFSRTYSSHSGDDRTYLGRGWQSGLESEVIQDHCGAFIVTGVAGQGQRYIPDGVDAEGVQQFRSPNGFHGTLRRLGSAFDFFSKDGTRYRYAQQDAGSVRLSSVEDPHGNRVRYEYETRAGHRLLRRLVDDAGRALNFEYAVQPLSRAYGPHTVTDHRMLLVRVSGPDRLRIDYRYDGEGNLHEVERSGDEGGRRVEAYEYEDLGSLWLTDPDGAPRQHHFGFRLTRARNARDESERQYDWTLGWIGIELEDNRILRIPEQRVRRLTEPDRGQTRFTYIGDRGIQTTRTEVVDARNERTTYTMNTHGAVERVEAPDGTTTTQWDLQHLQPSRVANALGTITHYTYDTHGNTVEERIEHRHGTLTRRWEFVAPEHFDRPIKHRPRSMTDARGIETRWGYDVRGNRTGQSRGGISEAWQYARNGDLLSYTDGGGARVDSEYDTYGFRTLDRDSLGLRWARRYDARGRLLSETDGRGNETTHAYDALDRRVLTRFPRVGGEEAEQTTIYDDVARTRTETDALGRTTVVTLDSMGRERFLRNADGDTREQTWDFNGNLLSATDFRGNLTRYSYDASNRRITQTGPGPRQARFSYDALGQMLSEEVSHSDGSQLRRSEYRYEHPLNLRTHVRQGIGPGVWAESLTSYDENGNVVLVTDPEARVTQRDYDNRDRLIEERAPEGRTTQYGYDGVDRRISETLNTEPAQQRGWAFDDRGREVLYRDATGAESRREYDLADNLIRRIDGRLNAWRYGYDARNRLVEEAGPITGQVSRYRYDAVGNQVFAHTPDGRELSHTYDLLNRRETSEDQLGRIEALTYDADNNMLSRTDAESRVTTSHWNALGQETRRDLPAVPAGPRALVFTYSVHGELLSETDANQYTTTHRYDGLGRRVYTRLPDDAERTAQFDSVGNLTASTDAAGFTTTFTYDGLNRRVTQVDPEPLATQQSWTYDRAGSVLTHIDRRGLVMRSTYDGENRLLSLYRDGVRRQTLAYDAVGNVVTETDANGEESTHIYDVGNRRLRTLRALQYEASWTYTPWGAVETATDADGFVTQHSYDVRQRLASETDAAGHTTTYGYDGVGNRVRLTRPLEIDWSFAFDAGDRLIEVRSPEDALTAYGYDRQGNRTTLTDAGGQLTTWVYDSRHRLVQSQHPDDHEEGFAYDAESRLRERTDGNGARTEVEVDALGRMTLRRYLSAAGEDIAEERWTLDGNGNPTLIEQVGADGQRYVTRREWDGQERLQAETDRFGQRTAYTFDAYGNRLRRDDPLGGTAYTLDRLHRTVAVRPEGDTAIQLSWSPEGRLLGLQHPNGAAQTVVLDDGGRIGEIVHRQGSTQVARSTYRYDLRGNREAETRDDAFGSTEIGYTYDLDDRLTGVDQQTGTLQREETFVLDAVGNRLSQETRENGTRIQQIRFDYGPRQRLEQRTDQQTGIVTTYAYDGNGALIQETTAGNTTGYRQNPQERLATLTLPGAPPVHYVYDSEGRRVEKRSASEARRFGWDGSQIRRETNVTNNLLAAYEWHAGRVLRSRTPSQTLYAQHDALRSPTRWSLADGTEQARRRYSAWGEDEAAQGEGPAVGYTGYYADAESGQYYAQQRYYRPGIGRFLQSDPGPMLYERPITINRYLYANGSPLIYIDPDGRIAILQDWQASIGSFGERSLAFAEDSGRNLRQGGWQSRVSAGAGWAVGGAGYLASMVGEGFVGGANLGANAVSIAAAEAGTALGSDNVFTPLAAEARTEIDTLVTDFAPAVDAFKADAVGATKAAAISAAVGLRDQVAAAARGDDRAVFELSANLNPVQALKSLGGSLARMVEPPKVGAPVSVTIGEAVDGGAPTSLQAQFGDGNPLPTKKPERTYVTYTADDLDNPGKTYTGRCSGPCDWDVQDILDRRKAGHHRNLGPLQLDQVTDSYAAIRGREHQVFEALKERGLATDQINPVSPRNKRRQEYFEEAKKRFGEP